MVANNHRNPHAKAHGPSNHQKLANGATPVKKERKTSICPSPKARSIQPRQNLQPGNRESAQSYGPRHLNLIYTAMSTTETSSDEDDRRSQVFDLPSANEPLLSVITTEQLRQSIRRKKVPPKTLAKPKLTSMKELQVQDFPKTMRPRKTSITEEEVIKLMLRQRVAPRQSLKHPHHQPRLKKAMCSPSLSATSSLNSDGWVPCGPANTTPKKPPSLAKEDITVVRQHLMLQRASISSANSFLGHSDRQRRASKPVKTTRQQSVRRKVSVVVRKDAQTPAQHQFFRSIRPGINLPEKVPKYPAQKPPPLPREHIIRTPPRNCPRICSNYSSSDSGDTNYDNHEPRYPLPPTKVSFVKLGSTRGKPPPIPKEQPMTPYRPLVNLPQRQRTYSISSTDSSEDHYTEPKLDTLDSGSKELQKVPLLSEDDLHTSFRNHDTSSFRNHDTSSFRNHNTSSFRNDNTSTPRSGSNSSNSGSSSIEYFESKSVTMTKRTLRSVSIKKSRYITPTYIKRSRSRVYETFRIKKSRMRPTKPIGPREIDPYARYCKPLRTPYKSEGLRAPRIVRAMKVIASCTGIAAIFRAIRRRR